MADCKLAVFFWAQRRFTSLCSVSSGLISCSHTHTGCHKYAHTLVAEHQLNQISASSVHLLIDGFTGHSPVSVSDRIMISHPLFSPAPSAFENSLKYVLCPWCSQGLIPADCFTVLSFSGRRARSDKFRSTCTCMRVLFFLSMNIGLQPTGLIPRLRQRTF